MGTGLLSAGAAGLLLAARAETVGDEIAAPLAELGGVAEDEALLEGWAAESFCLAELEEHATLEARRALVREEDGWLRLVGWGECG